MNFIKKQEIRFAKKLLGWKYKKSGSYIPSDENLTLQASQVVEEAHKIAKERGSNLAEIMKELIKDVKKKQ